MALLTRLVPDDFRRSLTPPVRRYFTGLLVSCAGFGLTLTLYVVYLHDVLRFSTNFSTLLLSASAAVGLVSSPLWGSLTDRVGPVPVMVVGAVLSTGAIVAWSQVRSREEAVVVGLTLAVVSGGGWGPGTTLLSRLVDAEHRQRAYGVNFLLVNLGVGVGGLVSASIVDLHHPGTFRVLYLANAVVTLTSGVVFATLWRYGHTPLDQREDRPHGGWGRVVTDRRLLSYFFASLLMMLGGYAAVDAGLSLFVVNELHLSVKVIGLFLSIDALFIVVTQLFILNFLEGRSRTRVLALVTALWALFWMVVAMAHLVSSGVAIAAIAVAITIFALGETMMSPVGSAIVNDIAPEELRGRYNAVSSLTWGFSGTAAPAQAALLFDHGLAAWWPLSVAGVSLLGGALMLDLHRRLTPAQDGR